MPYLLLKYGTYYSKIFVKRYIICVVSLQYAVNRMELLVRGYVFHLHTLCDVSSLFGHLDVGSIC